MDYITKKQKYNVINKLFMNNNINFLNINI